MIEFLNVNLMYLCKMVIIASFCMCVLQKKYKNIYVFILWDEALIAGIIFTPEIIYARLTALFIFELTCICLIYDDSVIKKVVLFLLLEIISTLCLLISNFICADSIERLYSNIYYVMLYVILYSGIMSIIFMTINKLTSQISLFLFIAQVILLIGECASVLVYLKNSKGGYTNNSYIEIIECISMLTANVFIGIIIPTIYKMHRQKENIDVGKELGSMEYKYYEMSLENEKTLHAMRHDISNQIQTIYALLVNGENKAGIELINSLKEEYSHIERLLYCENPVINIILSNKKAEAEKNGIEVNINIKDALCNVKITDYDLSTVICNLLDNAIQGCINSKQPSPKLIVEISVKNKHFVIRILNSCRIDMNVQSTDYIETTKTNSKMHGFGMLIIQDVVKKYNGDFMVSAENGLFIATTVMNIK